MAPSRRLAEGEFEAQIDEHMAGRLLPVVDGKLVDPGLIELHAMAPLASVAAIEGSAGALAIEHHNAHPLARRLDAPAQLERRFLLRQWQLIGARAERLDAH